MSQHLSRLLVLGDPHIRQMDMDIWEETLADFNQLAPAPEAILILGDLTGSDSDGPTGSPQANLKAVSVLKRFDRPWRSIIGNHDLEWKGHASDELAVANFLEVNRRDTPWFRWDLEHYTILGLSNTMHHGNPDCVHEIVLHDEQLSWLRDQLESLDDTPVVLAVHAPPVGSGLLTLAELHAQVGNAFANQNHSSGKLTKLLWQYPNVLFSFSGHNHLGQHYRDALSVRLGIHFVHTGVAGRHTRDGRRHSRVLDIYDDHFELLTWDHCLRQFDHSLTYRSTHSLQDWFNYRFNHIEKRFIAADPATMVQGPPPGPVKKGQARFVVFSDAHVVEPIQPVQRRCIEWACQQATAYGINHQILNGDLSHHQSAGQIKLFIHNTTTHHAFRHLIPGNNEGSPLPQGLKPHASFQLCDQLIQPLADFPGQTWALSATSYQDLQPAIEALLPHLPESGDVLIFAHFAPLNVESQAIAPLLARGDLRIHWIAGHEHASITRTLGNITVHICAGLDPMKVRDTLPEIILGQWDGQSLQLERRTVPLHMLRPPRTQVHQAGIAYLGSPVDHLDDALAHDISAIQFRDVHKHTEPVHDRIKAFREKFPQGRLSIHLPTPGQSEDGPDMAKLTPHIVWALEHGIEDWTIHLPSVDAPLLYTPDRQFQTTPWAVNCLERYKALAKQAIAANAQLSLENVNNNEKVPPEKELLSCRPWHVTMFIEKLRQMLRADGLSEEQVRRVGMIFDAGHAFTDPVVSKEHGLSDWVERTAPFIQMAHIHQAIRPGGEGSTYKRHREITTPAGRMINHLGLIALLMEKLPRPIVLLAEVRDRKEALTSVRTLQSILDGNQQ